jgi:hypothetical protein
MNMAFLHAQSQSPIDTTAKRYVQISFESTIHDFGIIPYKGNGTYVYVFTNTGTAPLMITNCVKGCGCTSVDWTKDPVLPGEKGMVKATYDTRKVGTFSRGVDVYSNASIPKINLRLKGTVEKAPENTPATN